MLCKGRVEVTIWPHWGKKEKHWTGPSSWSHRPWQTLVARLVAFWMVGKLPLSTHILADIHKAEKQLPLLHWFPAPKMPCPWPNTKRLQSQLVTAEWTKVTRQLGDVRYLPDWKPGPAHTRHWVIMAVLYLSPHPWRTPSLGSVRTPHLAALPPWTRAELELMLAMHSCIYCMETKSEDTNFCPTQGGPWREKTNSSHKPHLPSLGTSLQGYQPTY